MKKNLLLLSLLIWGGIAISQNNAFYSGKISPFTVSLLSSLEYHKNDSIERENISTKFGVKSIESKQYVSAYIELSDKKSIEVLKNYDIQINSVIGNFITVEIPVNIIEEVALLSEINSLEIATPVFSMMDKARATGNVDNVLSGAGLDFPYKGENVVIGIIDGGFEYGHINFFDEDNSELRVKRVWNQNPRNSKLNPNGYTYGSEYSTEEQILAAKCDSVVTGTHGTHVAGIAAGADFKDNAYYGVAPKSDIVLVSYRVRDSSAGNVSITDGIKYIYDYAESVGKPCVVNLSLGTHVGPHDGSSIFDRLSDELQGEGKLLVGAVGNEGTNNLHLSKTFTKEDNILQSFISFNSSGRLSGYCDIWGEENMKYNVQVVIYNRYNNTEVYATNIVSSSARNYIEYTLNSATDGAEGQISIVVEKNSRNNKPNVMVYTNLSRLNTGNLVGLKITSENGTVHAWADNIYSYFSNYNIAGWTNGDAESSMGEIGGTGNKIISVGAYVTNNLYSSAKLNDIADFSSKGPTADGRIKPEITAPGSAIISSFSSYAVENGYAYNTTKKTDVNGKSYYYGAMQGTSMAAPYITGVLATWLEAKSTLTPAEAKNILIKTAINDEYTGNISTTGSNVWGYGKVDAWNGIKECLELKTVEDSNPNKKLRIWKNSENGSYELIFPEEDTNIQIFIYNTGGRLIYKENLSSTPWTKILPLSNISKLEKGVYIVKVRGSKKTYNREKFIVY